MWNWARWKVIPPSPIRMAPGCSRFTPPVVLLTPRKIMPTMLSRHPARPQLDSSLVRPPPTQTAKRVSTLGSWERNRSHSSHILAKSSTSATPGLHCSNTMNRRVQRVVPGRRKAVIALPCSACGALARAYQGRGAPAGGGAPITDVHLGPSPSRVGPTSTGPKFRAKMPIVHSTASELSWDLQEPLLETAGHRHISCHRSPISPYAAALSSLRLDVLHQKRRRATKWCTAQPSDSPYREKSKDAPEIRPEWDFTGGL